MSSRREFLQHSAAASAALFAIASQAETARGYLANDTLQVGCIGTGGRCRGLMKSLVKCQTSRSRPSAMYGMCIWKKGRN